MNAPGGTLIAYSTAPGSVANDGSQRNGIYTQELLKNIQIPNLDIEEVLKHVRVSVRNLTAGQQVPWEASSLTGDFYFVSANSEAPTNVATTSLSNEPIAGSAEYYERRGSIFQRDEKYAEAEAEYRKGLRVDPNHKMLHILLGVVLTYQTKYEEAIDEYRKVLATDPENWNAASNLAMVYAEYGVGNSDEALKLAKLNVKNYSKDSLFEKELGWVYYRLEMYTDAIEHLHQAIYRGDKTSISHLLLGVALARKGENAKAQIELEEALRKNDLMPEQAEEARYELKLIAAELSSPAKDSPAPSSEIQESGNKFDVAQIFQKQLKGVMWLDHQTSYDGEDGFLEFMKDGSIKARTPKHREVGALGNTSWYLSGNTIYVIEYTDNTKKKIFVEYKGVIKSDRIEGTRRSGTLTTPWLLTKVIQ
jgi:tetratricopeptide (TPR) repeat protein